MSEGLPSGDKLTIILDNVMNTKNQNVVPAREVDEVEMRVSGAMKELGLRATARISYSENQSGTRMWSFYGENGRSLFYPQDDASAINSLCTLAIYARRKRNRDFSRMFHQMAEDKNLFLSSKWIYESGSPVRLWWLANLLSYDDGMPDEVALNWLKKHR